MGRAVLIVRRVPPLRGDWADAANDTPRLHGRQVWVVTKTGHSKPSAVFSPRGLKGEMLGIVCGMGVGWGRPC